MSERTRQQDMEDRKYVATYRLSSAIIDAIGELPPYPTQGQSRDIFQEWCEDEDGNIAITRLVNLIIH